MEALLRELVSMSRLEKAVAKGELTNGMELLVYPLKEGGMLIALGFGRSMAEHVDAEAVLRKRSENLPRFGDWLPALLADGSWYVVRRIEEADFDGDILPLLIGDELRAAEELLN